MRLLAGLLLCLPLLVHAGHYECKDAAGNLSYQLAPCKSQESRYIKDDAPPVSRRVDGRGQPVTTQVVKVGSHFYQLGLVNGHSIRMMVDTGASFVVVNRNFAMQAGLPSRGRSMQLSTANGLVSGYMVTASLWFAGHQVNHVPIVVQTTGQSFPGALLGMSFLRHFDMNISGDVLTLHRK